MSSALSTSRKDITWTSVPKIRIKSQKTSVSLATSMAVIGTKREVVQTVKAIGKNGKESKGKYPKNLAQVPCIWYPITFWKKSVSVLALFDSGSAVNSIYSPFTQELGLSIRSMDVRAYKIDNIIPDTFGIVVSAFSVIDKANLIKFFEKTFLVANINPKVVFGILFFILSNTDVNFSGRELQ